MSDSDKTDILVVDDLPEKRLAFEAVLNNLGQNVITASSGQEALKQVLLHDFAVILLDVNMPDMNGFETARIIRGRKRSGNTPIIFLTAFTDEVRTAEGYATGAVDYLPTPVVPEILRAKVRVFVELFQMRQQVAQQAEEKARHAASAEANSRLAFLSEAGAVLGRSLDFDATSRDVVHLPIPILADVSTLDCSPRSSLGRKTIISQLDEQGNYTAQDLKDNAPLPEELAHAMRQVTSSGERISLSGPNGVFCLVLPLQARGRTFGALALSREPSQRTFNMHDETMAVAFASRAAIALDNAVLHHELQAADRQKNEFLSMLAHELRNPLAPIRNATQLLGLRASDEPDLQWIRDVIERQVVQMVRLVDDLLDISRITRGKIDLQRAPVELATIVAHAVETSKPLIDSRNHQLAVALPTHPVWIHGDLTRLAQVLTNLLNNAAKYTEVGGQIWLTARHDGNSAIVSVRDTGSGVPPEMLNAIFDLFTQVNRTLDRSQGGLGIGLTLVRQLVEMHHGTVSAASDGPDRGSEFTVTLPVMTEMDSHNSPNRAGSLATGEPIKILVVDDNADSADSLARLLRLIGHQVDVAYDGPSGLAAAQIFEPSVIVLDIGLPGMDGFAVAERLRELKSTKDALLIALTGYGQYKDQLNTRQAGFDHHLTKPVELSALQLLLKSGRNWERQMEHLPSRPDRK
ncbi:MAG: hypothetical protein JWM11_2836 [Planctomycetaceae bacterium]|nr:hypothetical protein [Planctomycetaceae bacterium]